MFEDRCVREWDRPEVLLHREQSTLAMATKDREHASKIKDE
jgi:hypothetical protein